ncbi:hypothetical protein Bca101_020972 [Brassica carinata]
MHSRWALPGRTSAAQPPSSTSGEALLPPPFPPDPPDPSSPLSPHLFPPLASTPPLSRSEIRRSRLSPPVVDTVMTPALNSSLDAASHVNSAQFGSSSKVDLQSLCSLLRNPNSHVHQVTTTLSPPQEQADPTPLEPTTNNPTTLNVPLTKTTLPPPTFTTTTQQTNPLFSNPLSSVPILPTPQPKSAPTLAEKLRVKGDRSLTRLAPATFSTSGRPRVLIPDSVFQKGAELHKDFIVCYFNGRPPPFNHIQSVLCHMWGKGRRLEIHNNPLQRSVLVRIPSEFLRQKILDKNIWYVGDSMFHTAQWSSEHSSATPPLSSIKIWAHLTGVPLDLRYQHGLSLVAGLIGEPKETDDFTLNLVSLTLSHVKVEVDLTKPLPNVVEFERQSGEVVEVKVDYPWLPPTCSHCHELGHVVRNCLHFIPPKVPPATDTAEKAKKQASVKTKKTPTAIKTQQYVIKKATPVTKDSSSVTSQPPLMKVGFWNLHGRTSPNAQVESKGTKVLYKITGMSQIKGIAN